MSAALHAMNLDSPLPADGNSGAGLQATGAAPKPAAQHMQQPAPALPINTPPACAEQPPCGHMAPPPTLLVPPGYDPSWQGASGCTTPHPQQPAAPHALLPSSTWHPAAPSPEYNLPPQHFCSGQLSPPGYVPCHAYHPAYGAPHQQPAQPPDGGCQVRYIQVFLSPQAPTQLAPPWAADATQHCHHHQDHGSVLLASMPPTPASAPCMLQQQQQYVHHLQQQQQPDCLQPHHSDSSSSGFPQISPAAPTEADQPNGPSRAKQCAVPWARDMLPDSGLLLPCAPDQDWIVTSCSQYDQLLADTFDVAAAGCTARHSARGDANPLPALDQFLLDSAPCHQRTQPQPFGDASPNDSAATAAAAAGCCCNRQSAPGDSVQATTATSTRAAPTPGTGANAAGDNCQEQDKASVVVEETWKPWQAFSRSMGWDARLTKREVAVPGGAGKFGVCGGYMVYTPYRLVQVGTKVIQVAAKVALGVVGVPMPAALAADFNTLHFLFECPEDYAWALDRWDSMCERTFVPDCSAGWQFCKLELKAGLAAHRVLVVRRAASGDSSRVMTCAMRLLMQLQNRPPREVDWVEHAGMVAETVIGLVT